MVVTIDDGERQMILLALAELALRRPGWEATLRACAEESFSGGELFDSFQRTSSDQIPPGESPPLDEYLQRAQTQMIPAMQSSQLCISLLTGRVDAKIACELGTALLLEKPLIIAVMKGEAVPRRIRRLAEAVVEIDPDDQGAGQEKLRREIGRLLARFPEPESN